MSGRDSGSDRQEAPSDADGTTSETSPEEKSLLGEPADAGTAPDATAPGQFHLVEPCSGAAALTLRLLGAKRQLLPYQGSKWRLSKQLVPILAERGCTELVSVHLGDTGPWGHTWGLLRHNPHWILSVLREMAAEDPRVVYDRLHKAPTPSVGSPTYAAEHLFLQRLSHSGKAVGVRDRCWRSPGFNETSANGKPATDRIDPKNGKRYKFGPIKPMIPALIRQIEAGWAWPAHWQSSCTSASNILGQYRMLELANGRLAGIPIVVFLDPPYARSTRYPNGHMTRLEVVTTARLFAELGFFVVVAEAEPIDLLVDKGWEARCLKLAPGHDSPFRAKGEEWVTLSPPL